MAITSIYMARTTIKATYSLPPEIVDRLERLARRWGISRSAAVGRAITAAESALEPGTATSAFDKLQRGTPLSAEDAEHWVHSVQTERRASRRRV